MDVAGPVVEGGEEKTVYRIIYDPVPDPVLDAVVLRVVAKARLGEGHRTDAAQYVVVDCIGGVVHLHPVGGLAGHVVGGVDEENEIVLPKVIVLDHLIVKLGHQHVVCEPAVLELHQELLGSALLLLLQRKAHIEEVFPDSAGQSPLEQIKILVFLLLGEREEGLLEFQFLFLVSVHIAAADAGDGAVLQRELLSDFQNFFFIHEIPLFLLYFF